MPKSKNEICARIAQIAQSLEDNGNLNLAKDLDVVLENVNQNLIQEATPEAAPIVQSTDSKPTKISAKLSKRQKAAMRGFYRSASRMLDTVSVGRREFPEKNVRSAVSKIIASVDDGLDLLEEFGGVVSSQDKIERHAATNSNTKVASVDSELRLYAALKTKMTKEEMVSKNILTAAEVEDIEGYSAPSDVCPECGNELVDGKCMEGHVSTVHGPTSLHASPEEATEALKNIGKDFSWKTPSSDEPAFYPPESKGVEPSSQPMSQWSNGMVVGPSGTMTDVGTSPSEKSLSDQEKNKDIEEMIKNLAIEKPVAHTDIKRPQGVSDKDIRDLHKARPSSKSRPWIE